MLPLAAVVVWSANRTRDERVAEARGAGGDRSPSAPRVCSISISRASTRSASSLALLPARHRSSREPKCSVCSTDALRTQPLLLNIVADRRRTRTDRSRRFRAAGSTTARAAVHRGVMADGRPHGQRLPVGRISGQADGRPWLSGARRPTARSSASSAWPSIC